MTDDKKKLLPLTPNEEVTVEKSTYETYLKERAIYEPPPKPRTGDLIHENRRVMNVLTRLVGWLPALLGLVMVASIVVSLDKTAAAFHASVANHAYLFGFDAWAFFVAVSGVVMADAALAIAEYALVRDMLSKNLPRQVFTLKTVVRSLRVFVGKEKPLDYHEMPDPALHFYHKFLFVLVLSANVYAVTKTGNIKSLSDFTFENGLLVFVGVAGALSIRFVGRQVAHITYELAKKRQAVEEKELEAQWRQHMTELWHEDGPRLVSTALHRKYALKNGLPLDTNSPYLLMSDQDEKGEDRLVAVPLVTSPRPSGQHSPQDPDS